MRGRLVRPAVPVLVVLALAAVPSLPFVVFGAVAAGDEDDIDELWGDTGEDGGTGWQAVEEQEVTPGGFLTPDASTVWEHGQTDVPIEWSGFEGDTVRLELLCDGERIADLTSWHLGEGRFVRTAPVAGSWGSGRHFRVRIVDRDEDSVTSEEFLILAPFSVITPDADTGWAHEDRSVPVSWTSIDGSTVKIELVNSMDLSTIAVLTPGTLNTGSFLIERVSPDWGTGDGYTIRITDDLGNFTYGEPFHISGVRVEQPTASGVWRIGETPPDILWRCSGTIVSIELWKEGGAEPSALLAEWVPNTGSLSFDSTFDHSLLQAGTGYFVRIVNDLEQSGLSEPFEVTFSDNIPEGALGLVDSDSGRIDPAGDNDLWLVHLPGGREGRVTVSSEEPLSVSVRRAGSGEPGVSSRVAGTVEWYSGETADYYVDVRAESPLYSGDYTIEYSHLRTRDRERRFRIGLFAQGGLGAFRVGLSWFPKRWLEVGLEMLIATVDPDVYLVSPCSTMVYLGPSLSYHHGLTGGLGGYAGFTLLGRLTECGEVFVPGSEDYEEPLEGGFRAFLGLDYRLLSSRRGMALYLTIKYLLLANTEGMVDLGVQAAF